MSLSDGVLYFTGETDSLDTPTRPNADICDFLRFQISEKLPNLQLPLDVQKQKVFQLHKGGFTP